MIYVGHYPLKDNSERNPAFAHMSLLDEFKTELEILLLCCDENVEWVFASAKSFDAHLCQLLWHFRVTVVKRLCAALPLKFDAIASVDWSQCCYYNVLIITIH